jgi:signal transduction histidine kinase
VARHIAFAVVVSLVLSALVLVVFRHRFLQTTMERSARTYSALVSGSLVDWVLFLGSTGSSALLDQQVTRLRELNDDVERLEVVRVTGEIILRAERDGVFTFGDDGTPPKIADRDLLRAIVELEPSAARVDTTDGARVYRVVAPVVKELGQHGFSLVATFSYDNVNRQLRFSMLLSALILATGLALTHWVSVALARGITHEVEILRAGVQRIEEGHLEERVSVHSEDEIHELADAFNRMADELLATIRRLREANRELETLDQTKADLVANVSHELKTPLTALRGYLELMLDGGLGPLPTEAERAAEVCRKNVQRLSLRIEELVQVSRLERFTSLDAAREEVEIGSLLRGVVDTFRPRFEGGGMKIVLDVRRDVRSVMANPEQAERVFLNLLDNAVKFTPEGGTVLVIAEACDQGEREGVLVRVQDSGVGIPSSELTRIFDRFYQVDPSVRRRFGGMGLGLSLVLSIVEAHGGTVWAESEQGVGSTFFVWLPCYEDERNARGGERSSARLDAADSEDQDVEAG